MPTKLSGREGGGDRDRDGDGEEGEDPFTNDLVLSSWDWVKISVGTLVLVPFRAVGILATLLLAWIVAKLGLIGEEENNEEKANRFSGSVTKKFLLSLYSYLGLVLFWCAGFSVKLKGRQSSREEAPVLVGAPHSSFLEALLIVMCQSSPVSRHENKNALLISACQKFTQTIFVDRRSSASRRLAADAICDRVRAAGKWLQVFIFPEGTNTNRRLLIQFKNGAFNPGVPVQPVLIRYHGYGRHSDSITWTFRQSHSYLMSIWLILAKPVNRIEIEFLPVYNPNEEERENPSLFAKNVQKIMAKELQVEASDITYHQYYEDYCKKFNLLSKEN